MTPHALADVPRLVVASYNVHRCIGADGRRDEARVARVITSLGADVVGLQEVESWPVTGRAREPLQMGVLGHLSGMQAISGPTIEREDGHFGNALLTRLPVVAVRKRNITWKNREPRGALDVVLQTPHGSVRVIATHLGLSPGERRFQVQRLLDITSTERERVTVLLGDINEWLIMGRPLRWLHARFGDCPGRRTFPAHFPLFALDRIWVHPKQALRSFEAFRAGEARTASDHLPVRAELSLAFYPATVTEVARSDGGESSPACDR